MSANVAARWRVTSKSPGSVTHAKLSAGPENIFSVQSCSVSFLRIGAQRAASRPPDGHQPRVTQGLSKCSRLCFLSLCELVSAGPSLLPGTDRNTFLGADATPREAIPIRANAQRVQDQQQQSAGAARRVRGRRETGPRESHVPCQP